MANYIEPVTSLIEESTYHTQTKKVSLGFQLLLSLANIVVWLSVIPLYQLQLPAQIAVLDPHNKAASLAFIVFIAGIAGLISQPIAGALSDRTTSRFGRRRPWMLAGALFGSVALLLMANAQSIALLAVEVTMFGLAIGMVLAPVIAIIPDRVPEQQRATVSAFVGLAQPVGTLLGIILIAQVIRSIQGSYYAIAAILFVVILLFVLTIKETALPKDTFPPFNFIAFAKSFFVNPIKYPDFGFVWLARFFVIMAQTIVATFILFYLQDVIHYDKLFPGQTAEQGVSIFQLVYTLFLIVSSIAAGVISDRLQKRKWFVIAASVIMTLAFLLLTLVPTWTSVLVVAAVFGIGFGIFVSSDVALATQVLPSKKDQGKDMGLIYAAATLPELLFPLISFVAFGLLNGYPALFGIATVSTLLGTICILPVKSVK